MCYKSYKDVCYKQNYEGNFKSCAVYKNTLSFLFFITYVYNINKCYK